MVSIILPVYNGSEFLQQAIDSVLNQSYKDWELIIINDGSTDMTSEIIRGYSCSKIKKFEISHSGLANALNFGIEHSSGEWIAIIASDDVWLPEKLNLQISYLLAHKDIVLIGGSVKFIDNNNVILKRKGFNNSTEFTDAKIRNNIIHNNLFCHSTVIIKSSVFNKSGKYNQKFVPSEDYELWSRVLQYGKTHILKEIIAFYRIREDSISSLYPFKQILFSAFIRFLLIKRLNYPKKLLFSIFWDISRLLILFSLKKIIKILS